MADYEKVKANLEVHDQAHLLKFYDQLDETQKKALLEQIESLDLDYIVKCFNQCTKDLNKGASLCEDKDLEPVPADVFGSTAATSQEQMREYEEEGLRQIGEGKVAALLLAGGQGTRLGVSYPKGMYDVGLPSKKTLFQLMAERLIKLQKMAEVLCGKACVVPWYIMTSGPTHDTTVKYFKDNAYFGLAEENVVFFNQGCMPCVEFNGKIILETPHAIAQAPDGNGGLYSAIQRSKIVEDMEKRSVKYLHVFCVDNILLRIADPVFIGFCLSKKAHCGYKVVEKTDPTEPVGVICKYKGHYHVMEYSEISKELSEMRSEDGKLTYNGGGIANHFFTVEFIKEVIQKEKELTHHVAKKKIPYCGEDGQLVKPATPNGIKMEKFIFDVFQFTNDFAVWEVKREEEFSPLKNADSAGADCPSTSRESIFNLHKKWIEKAGGVVPAEGKVVCEVSPLVSYAGEGLEELVNGKTFADPICL